MEKQILIVSKNHYPEHDINAHDKLSPAKEDNPPRVDQYIANALPKLTRSFVQKLIKNELVKVNEKVVKSNYRVSPNDVLEINFPPPTILDLEAEEIPLDIIYEDSELLVINKAKNMVVHPAPGHYSGTVVNAILHHCKEGLSGINGIMRPGIVHRIDKDTTGALLVCKTDDAHQSIAKQLKEHSIKRIYHAIVCGNISKDRGTIEANIGRHSIHRKKMSIHKESGREAITHFKVLERFGDYTYVACQLDTGRTHQIRVHMASIGHPILGDEVYGSRKKTSLEGQVLHAKTLGFIHPKTNEYMELDAQLPTYFIELIEKLRHNV